MTIILTSSFHVLKGFTLHGERRTRMSLGVATPMQTNGSLWKSDVDNYPTPRTLFLSYTDDPVFLV